MNLNLTIKNFLISVLAGLTSLDHRIHVFIGVVFIRIVVSFLNDIYLYFKAFNFKSLYLKIKQTSLLFIIEELFMWSFFPYFFLLYYFINLLHLFLFFFIRSFFIFLASSIEFFWIFYLYYFAEEPNELEDADSAVENVYQDAVYFLKLFAKIWFSFSTWYLSNRSFFKLSSFQVFLLFVCSLFLFFLDTYVIPFLLKLFLFFFKILVNILLFIISVFSKIYFFLLRFKGLSPRKIFKILFFELKSFLVTIIMKILLFFKVFIVYIFFSLPLSLLLFFFSIFHLFFLRFSIFLYYLIFYYPAKIYYFLKAIPFIFILKHLVLFVLYSFKGFFLPLFYFKNIIFSFLYIIFAQSFFVSKKFAILNYIFYGFSLYFYILIVGSSFFLNQCFVSLFLTGYLSRLFFLMITFVKFIYFYFLLKILFLIFLFFNKIPNFYFLLKLDIYTWYAVFGYFITYNTFFIKTYLFFFRKKLQISAFFRRNLAKLKKKYNQLPFDIPYWK